MPDDVVHLAGDPPSLGGQRSRAGEPGLLRAFPLGGRRTLGADGAVQPFPGQPGEDPDQRRDQRVGDLVGEADVGVDDRYR
ncbi:MAG: hypothetical protein M3Q47_14940 [Actinomycetota bacterium]|nr:hypothetical protein [Actinomycetota bacterium]